MKHKSIRAIVLTALYIGIIFIIFVIQFTIGKTFSYTIGSMTISGRHEVNKDGQEGPLLPLHIVANGLDFYITEQNPVVLETADKKKLPVKIKAYKKTDKSFTVECSNNAEISFLPYSVGDMEAVKISANMPKEFINIYFPWKLTQTARLERQDKRIFLRYGKNRYVFKGGYTFDNSNDEETEIPYFSLTNTNPIASYETYIQSQSLAFDSIQNSLLASYETYLNTKKSFANKALSYLENAIVSKNYTEETIVAYLAEMAARNEYQKAIRTVEQSSFTKEKKTYVSCTFFDNLVENEKGLVKADKEKINLILKNIAKKDISVFENKKLIKYLVDHSKKSTIDDLQKLAKDINDEDIDAHIASGIIEASLDFSIYFSNNINIFNTKIEQCENKLKSSLFSIDDGLFISADGKHIDSKKTLEIADILIRYGTEYIEKNTWKYIGQMLYSSILSYAGESASLPAYFDIQGDATTKLGLMANDTVILHADKLYSLAITDNNYFPHQESFALNAEQGMWAWSSAKSISVTQNTAKQFSLKIDSQTNNVHYLIIRGIRPFYKIKIHGIDFKTDQRFEIYNSSGYIYNERSGTLLLKLKHKKTSEEVILFLGKPPSPAKIPVQVAPLATQPVEVDNSSEKGSVVTDDATNSDNMNSGSLEN